MVNSMLFKWEDSQALKHHCGVYERSLAHPGAKAMFIRGRGHSCIYCRSINEAHYKRHHKIAEQLRAVYDGSGESDWSLIPSDPETSLTPEEAPSSKREKKDAKSLAKAATRSRFVTQDEYHAQEYNTKANRPGLKKFAQASAHPHVDFDAEMNRSLDELRNTKTKGMQGKELESFLALVDDFKRAVVEDIVLDQKDAAEVRMRRAGFLRYTNRTSYTIMEERYTDKDWKTGEKFTACPKDTDAAVAPVEEATPPIPDQQVGQPPEPAPVPQVPDRRHLEVAHRRVNGDDGLDEAIIEPGDAPRLSPQPDPTPNKKPVSLRVLSIKNSGGQITNATPQASGHGGWLTVTNEAEPTTTVGEPHVWGDLTEPCPSEEASAANNADPSSCSRNSTSDAEPEAPAVQAPTTLASNGPESFLASTGEPTNGHPAVAQRRKSKRARGARGTAKGYSVLEKVSEDPVAQSNAAEEIVSSESAIPHPAKEAPSAPLSSPAPVTKPRKHMDWVRFSRTFLSDQLTNPFSPSWSECAHETSCALVSAKSTHENDVVECSFRDCTALYVQRARVTKPGDEKGPPRWYCPSCIQEMQIAARFPHILDEDDRLQKLFEQRFEDMCHLPDEEADRLIPPGLRTRIMDLGGFANLPESIKRDVAEQFRANGGGIGAGGLMVRDGG
ncbi:hypothetical protein BDW02DRAFT_601128 [Decorospora gaudefroyi]|uniref:Zinc finger PHD-type domain-containing protein n=1 Tax=Decorospora gaudefroyi TaxID=184978 RepID=A0A6A5K4S7_9PLEO|nr:hypothetical protein BDW02DRAFT_601128 [Decorospora gaudefroyi]